MFVLINRLNKREGFRALHSCLILALQNAEVLIEFFFHIILTGGELNLIMEDKQDADGILRTNNAL